MQNTILFGVKLRDYHNRMKTAASRSSAIINFDAMNRQQFFLCQMQVAQKTGARICHQIYGTGFWSVCQALDQIICMHQIDHSQHLINIHRFTCLC